MPIIKAALSPLWLLSVAVAAAAGSSITGVVVDGNGAPIAYAVVFYSSLPSRTSAPDGRRISTGPFVGSGVKTGTDGSFTVAGLPAATYSLCAYGPKADHLGTCEWGDGARTITLADGQPAQLRFVVAEGTLLTFQVEDPKHRVVDLESLPRTDGRIPLSGGNFAVGVWAGTRYLRAGRLSTAGVTRRYQVAIPKAATVRLFLDTTLNVADNTGAALSTRRLSTPIAAGGQSEVVINLAIP